MSVGQALNLLSGQPVPASKVQSFAGGKATPDESISFAKNLAIPKIFVQKADPDILVLRLPSLDRGAQMKYATVLLDAENRASEGHWDVANAGAGRFPSDFLLPRLFRPSRTIHHTARPNGFSAGFFV